MATLDELRPGDRVWAKPAQLYGTVQRILPRPEKRDYPIVVELENGTQRAFAPEELDHEELPAKEVGNGGT